MRLHIARSVLCVVEARGQERARKLGCASSRGPEAPIIVYNDPARSRGQTRSPRRRTGCSNMRSKFNYLSRFN
ncbi:hypothetical protein POSPLADRAFT_1142451 [Postia placenta MAD-698-R-SB12]|uniref:Uncharacterized protein n=1 Tax=Postia placenta MAD-698-R-SB12 TaxID=670580 RepID=A0A1X6N0J3_9APHY|nr:hypothetical protein POSPLADRAFT_1142451 [Postia placenta MAD-698-R-SB12]OSX62135.1 hypothetical protein POSPLADRAFT_1142451 [Postia placenta MAD-698-R-SB12]